MKVIDASYRLILTATVRSQVVRRGRVSNPGPSELEARTEATTPQGRYECDEYIDILY